MNCPQNLKYTKEHIWVAVENDIAVMGITDFAQSELGEIVFIELPKENDDIKKDAVLAVAESTKAASDIYCPIDCTVSMANEELSDSPSLINTDPYKNGWIAKLSNFDKSHLDSLMTAKEYEDFISK